LKTFLLLFACTLFTIVNAQDSMILLKPDRVFDGEQMHTDWVVLVKGNKIASAGPLDISQNTKTRIIDLKGMTLLPGLIEGHSHLFLHPYNETVWNDQVLKESRAERIIRAADHAKSTLMAGFTTVRDLGTEGAMYDDAGLKKSIEKNLIPGPRMIIATRAIVGKGAYGPHFDNTDIDLPQGAAEVGNKDELEKEVRLQISKGADVVKIYEDYRWGINGRISPVFSVDELKAAVAIAHDAGTYVTVHSTSPEGMMRAIEAGVHTIEHGDDGTPEVFKAMKEKGVALCPTLAAGDAISQYFYGWKKGSTPEPSRITTKKKSFKEALESGVTICMGGDVGVFPHGENAREILMMVEYGMKPLAVLKSATSVNADVFGYGDKIGRIKEGLLADIIAVKGDPSKDMNDIKNVMLVMKDGKIYVDKTSNKVIY
jgi:imidazolonepropionase-like amidohydrolase